LIYKLKKATLSLILACYNEGPTLEDSVTKIVSVLKKIKGDWEIIFVDDKSTDDTRKALNAIASASKKFKVIYHNRNQGRGRSVSDGIKAAKGDMCGYLDVDLEVSADYLPLFLREVEEGSDLVVGQRFYEGGGFKALSRFFASKIYAYSVKMLFNSPVDDTEAGYKFFKKSKILPILSKIKNKRWFWDTEICVKASISGLKVTQIPVLFKRRADKKSTVRLIPDTIDYISNLIRLKKELST